jgi:hypothetical protein
MASVKLRHIYPKVRRSQIHARCAEEEKKPFYPFRESNPKFSVRIARGPVTKRTELSCLIFKTWNRNFFSSNITTQEISPISVAVSQMIHHYYYLEILNALDSTKCNVSTALRRCRKLRRRFIMARSINHAHCRESADEWRWHFTQGKPRDSNGT